MCLCVPGAVRNGEGFETFKRLHDSVTGSGGPGASPVFRARVVRVHSKDKHSSRDGDAADGPEKGKGKAEPVYDIELTVRTACVSRLRLVCLLTVCGPRVFVVRSCALERCCRRPVLPLLVCLYVCMFGVVFLASSCAFFLVHSTRARYAAALHCI